MAMRFLTCAAVLALAACATTPEPTAQKPATPTAPSLPSTGGFSPLRPQVVDIPGHGTFACMPTQTGGFSGCTPAPAGTTLPAAPAPEPVRRPGSLPVSAVGGPPDLPAGVPPEGSPITLPTFGEDAEIPMTQG